MSASVKRPAHRPSRRGVIVETAFELFAATSVEAVTVADIAAASDMTSAAIYYHYPSREEILLEGLRDFSVGYVAEMRRLAADVIAPERSIGAAIEPFFRWLDAHRTSALVYFVSSRGASQRVEAIRRENGLALVPLLSSAARKARGTLSAAEAGIIAVAVIAQLETYASSLLSADASFTALGRRKFVDSAVRLADRIAGTTED